MLARSFQFPLICHRKNEKIPVRAKSRYEIENNARLINGLHYGSMVGVYWRECLWWGTGNAHLRMPQRQVLHRASHT